MERDTVNDCCRELFMETDKPIIYEKIDDEKCRMSNTSVFIMTRVIVA
jgi:hypothetical protein